MIAKSLLGAALAAVIAASAHAEPAPEEIKLGFIPSQLENPFFMGVKEGVEAFCKDRGISCTVIDPEYDAARQAQLVDKLIAENYQAILVTPIDYKLIVPEFEKAKKAGIVTGSLAQNVPNADFQYQLNEHEYGYTIGRNAGAWAKVTLGCEGTAALVTQDNVEDIIPRTEGIIEALNEACPTLKIVAREAGDTPSLGEKIIKKVLETTPDLNLAVATNDSGGLGAYKAFKALPENDGVKRAVFSGDATKEVLELLKEERGLYQGTVDLYPFQSGYQAADFLYGLVVMGVPDGGEVEPMSFKIVNREEVLNGRYVPSH